MDAMNPVDRVKRYEELYDTCQILLDELEEKMDALEVHHESM